MSDKIAATALAEVEKAHKEHAECIDYYEAKLIEYERKFSEDSAEVERLTNEIKQWKKVYNLRGIALQRPCINCGHTPLRIHADAALGTADRPTVGQDEMQDCPKCRGPGKRVSHAVGGCCEHLMFFTAISGRIYCAQCNQEIGRPAITADNPNVIGNDNETK